MAVMEYVRRLDATKTYDTGFPQVSRSDLVNLERAHVG